MDKAIPRNGRRGWLISAGLLAGAVLAGAVGQYAVAGTVALVALLALVVSRAIGRRRAAAVPVEGDMHPVVSADLPQPSETTPVPALEAEAALVAAPAPDSAPAPDPAPAPDFTPDAIAIDGSEDGSGSGGPAAAAEAPAPVDAPVLDAVPADTAQPASAPANPNVITPSRASFLSFDPDDPGPATADLHPLVPSRFDWSLAPPHGEQAGPDLRRLVAAADGSGGMAAAPVWDIKTYGSTESLNDWRDNRRPGQHDAMPTYVTRRTAASEESWLDQDEEAETASGLADRAEAGTVGDEALGQEVAAVVQADAIGATPGLAAAEHDEPAEAAEEAALAGSVPGEAVGQADAPGPTGPDPVDDFLAAIAAKAGLAGAGLAGAADGPGPEAASVGDLPPPAAPAAMDAGGDEGSIDFRSAVAALMAIRGPTTVEAPEDAVVEDADSVAGRAPDGDDSISAEQDPAEGDVVSASLDARTDTGPDGDGDRVDLARLDDGDGTEADSELAPEGHGAPGAREAPVDVADADMVLADVNGALDDTHTGAAGEADLTAAESPRDGHGAAPTEPETGTEGEQQVETEGDGAFVDAEASLAVADEADGPEARFEGEAEDEASTAPGHPDRAVTAAAGAEGADVPEAADAADSLSSEACAETLAETLAETVAAVGEPADEARDGDADLRPAGSAAAHFSELAAAAAAGRRAARAKVNRRAGPSFGALLAARRAELKAHPSSKTVPSQEE